MSTADSRVKRVGPAKPKTIHVNLARCKGCELCVEICPMRSKEVLKISEELSRRGYRYPIVNNLDACTGCDLCAIICPDFSIFLEFDEQHEKVQVSQAKL